jgi:hypothetical protein
LDELTDRLDLRGELYYLRLYPRFKERLSSVTVFRDIERATNRVEVLFKNGRKVETDEANINDDEFLAKCIMVNDL